MSTHYLCAQKNVHVGDCVYLLLLLILTDLTYGVALEITDTVLPNCQFPKQYVTGKVVNAL